MLRHIIDFIENMRAEAPIQLEFDDDGIEEILRYRQFRTNALDKNITKARHKNELAVTIQTNRQKLQRYSVDSEKCENREK